MMKMALFIFNVILSVWSPQGGWSGEQHYWGLLRSRLWMLFIYWQTVVKFYLPPFCSYLNVCHYKLGITKSVWHCLSCTYPYVFPPKPTMGTDVQYVSYRSYVFKYSITVQTLVTYLWYFLSCVILFSVFFFFFFCRIFCCKFLLS